MKKHLISFLILFLFSSTTTSASSCPVDLSYVETFPWDTSLCRHPIHKDCCQTLVSLFAIGMANYLKQTSSFQLPSASASSSCLSGLGSRLESLSVAPSLVPACFAADPSGGCAGIATTRDWDDRAGPAAVALLRESCDGDLTGFTRCGSCVDAGMKANSRLKGLDQNGTECFHFTVLYAAGIVNELGPNDPTTASCILGLPLSRRESKGLSRRSFLRILFGCLGGIVVIIIGVVSVVVKRRRNTNARRGEFVSGFGAKWFRFAELERATEGFSRTNLVGRGSYRGTLSDGTVVAVKRLLVDSDSEGDEEFRKEVEIIGKIRHRNLLSLRGGCCCDGEEGRRRFLVYDFMSNGNLGDCLSKTRLSWPQRKSVIMDVAKGLEYLHYGVKPAIYHSNVKATNILLDSEMRAKLSNFGLAKQSKDGQSHVTTRVVGTHSYMAPEYALHGQVTEKSDVYSFGIVILEIMSGKKALDATSQSAVKVVHIADWAWWAVKSGRVDEVFDEAVRKEGPKAVMERFVRVGILCSHVMVALRPTLSEALRMLEGDIDIPVLPDRPLPLSHGSFGSSFGHEIV